MYANMYSKFYPRKYVREYSLTPEIASMLSSGQLIALTHDYGMGLARTEARLAGIEDFGVVKSAGILGNLMHKYGLVRERDGKWITWILPIAECVLIEKYHPESKKGRPAELELSISFPHPWMAQPTEDTCELLLWEILDVLVMLAEIEGIHGLHEIIQEGDKDWRIEAVAQLEYYPPMQYWTLLVVDAAGIQFFERSQPFKVPIGRYTVSGFEYVIDMRKLMCMLMSSSKHTMRYAEEKVCRLYEMLKTEGQLVEEGVLRMPVRGQEEEGK